MVRHVWILSVLVALQTPAVKAQECKPNTLFTQIAFANYHQELINASVNYGRRLYRRNAFQLGGYTGVGTSLAPSFYFILPIIKEAHFFQLVGTAKFGKQRHFFGIDTGYSYVDWKDRREDMLRSHHHANLTLSYQYQSPSGFHGQLGFSSWQGIVLGLGRNF